MTSTRNGNGAPVPVRISGTAEAFSDYDNESVNSGKIHFVLF
jgi:hypothetical protein